MIEKVYTAKNIKVAYKQLDTSNNNDYNFVKEYEMILNNFPEEAYNKIIDSLYIESKRKITRQFEIIGIPGLSKLLHKTNNTFRAKLEDLQGMILKMF